MALFGRKINHAEHQLAFIEMLHLITDGRISPEEAVRAYHAVLQARKIRPHRSLEDDLKLTDQSMSYESVAHRRSTVTVANNPPTTTGTASDLTEEMRSLAVPGQDNVVSAEWPKRADGSPDFGSMSSSQRLAYDRWRLSRRFG